MGKAKACPPITAGTARKSAPLPILAAANLKDRTILKSDDGGRRPGDAGATVASLTIHPGAQAHKRGHHKGRPTDWLKRHVTGDI